MKTLPQTPHTLVQSIARMEGFYADGTTKNRPQRNHNPCNVEYGILAIGAGAQASDGRFAIFPTDKTGYLCAVHLLSGPDYRDLTIREAINKFAPADENDTIKYVGLICEWRNCSPFDLIYAIMAEDTEKDAAYVESL